MPDKNFLGQDLDLGLIADEEGRVFAGPQSYVDVQARTREDISPHAVDLGTVTGKANLAQSLILRLKTQRGELKGLGHPDYGSRHHELLGEPNTNNNRNLIKLYVLECLRQEPRLEKIEKVEVAQTEGKENRDKVEVRIKATVKDSPTPISLVVPFMLEGSIE
jgi:phage baseplate assembly protein W